MGGDEEAQPEPAVKEMTEKPRRWVMDRCDGKSQIQKEELGRPFCPLCWPPPCVKFLPDLFEQNACCEFFGKIGVFPEDDPLTRIWLMRKSMVIHLAGLIMSILAATAITSNQSLLQKFPFSDGVITGYVADINIQQVIMKVGLTTVFVQDDYLGARTQEFDELCTGTTLGIPLTSQAECNTCKEASAGLVTSMILGVITYIPTIASNINRSYYNYDVNCQKVFGTVIAFFNMIMSLYGWQVYKNACFATFYEGEVALPVLVPVGFNATTVFDPQPFIAAFQSLNATWMEATVGVDPELWDVGKIKDALVAANNGTFFDSDVETEVRVARVLFDWKPGVGLILCVVATFLKMIDILNHSVIRTPSITRDLQEQLEYEKLYGGDEAEANADDEDEEANDKSKIDA
ncbi:expressed unknown protein [Seminavis robusta]|uniref:Uncharacterized protein n=1 Tax=Seminavis robusta TaxID=568900 RepID=A0A9N8D6Q0_9STRA|nr:expressed unknown protein [Seminavis robusta]|eukprot:Sro20_g014250.1 n/a (404) ;mRNA; f:121059-122270